MSVRNRFVLPIILSALAVLAACGGSSSNPVIPPPTGSFSNTDLSGTYVFSATGSDFNGAFLTMVGTFTACGCSGGTISGGTIDMNDPNFSAPLVAQAITGGIYEVTSDGRGQAKFTVNTPFGSSMLIRFVLSTSTHGLVTEFDGNGTGSGTLDLQSTVTQAQVAGSYAFGFTGISGISSINGSGIPLGTVGGFTLDSNGNITAGLQDFNSNGISAGISDLALSGSVDLSTMPGIATLTTSVGTYSFDVYPVDMTHLKFIEIDATPIVAGDVFTQTSTIPASNAFTVAGFDSILGGPFTAAGLITTDGASQITSGSTEDINDVGNYLNVASFTGSFTPVSGGRSVFTLNGFANGASGAIGSYTFAAYPSTGGIELLEIDNAGGITAGVAYNQTATTLADAQGYGFNLTGINAGNGLGTFEEDAIAEFTNNSGTLTGLIDFNDQGSTSSGQRFTEAYAATGAASRAQITSNNLYNLVSYVVDSGTTVFVEIDSNQVGLGSFGLQTPGAKSNLATMHLAALRAKPGARNISRRKQK